MDNNVYINIVGDMFKGVMKETILYFFDYGEAYGGAVNTLLKQMILMRAYGYQVYGVVSGYDGNSISKDYEAAFKVSDVVLEKVNYPICSHTEDIDIIETLQCYDDIKAVIQRYNPVLLHSVQINPTVELVSREFGIPHIMDVYQACPEFFAFPYVNLFPQYHICDSICFAEAWQQGLNIKSFCVRTTASQYVHKNHVGKKEYVKCICVGDIVSRKNQLEVIKGFHKALVGGIHATLDLYGGDLGDYAAQCRQYIIDNHLENVICLQGFCTDMPDVYADADILICGSKVESYPNAVSEALANGVIVVTTPVAGVPEVIKDQENGYVCSGYTADEVAEGVAEAFYAFRFGKVDHILQNANATFERVHSEKSVAAELIKIYNDVIRLGAPKGLLGKDELEKLFADLIKKYRDGMEKFDQRKSVERKLWYLYHIIPRVEKQLQQGKKIYIWGAGKIGQQVMQMCNVLMPEWTIQGFLDRRKTGKYMGYSVSDPEEVISHQNIIVFLAFYQGADEAMKELKQLGKTYGEDYFLLAPRSW